MAVVQRPAVEIEKSGQWPISPAEVFEDIFHEKGDFDDLMADLSDFSDRLFLLWFAGSIFDEQTISQLRDTMNDFMSEVRQAQTRHVQRKHGVTASSIIGTYLRGLGLLGLAQGVAVILGITQENIVARIVLLWSFVATDTSWFIGPYIQMWNAYRMMAEMMLHVVPTLDLSDTLSLPQQWGISPGAERATAAAAEWAGVAVREGTLAILQQQIFDYQTRVQQRQGLDAISAAVQILVRRETEQRGATVLTETAVSLGYRAMQTTNPSMGVVTWQQAEQQALSARFYWDQTGSDVLALASSFVVMGGPHILWGLLSLMGAWIDRWRVRRLQRLGRQQQVITPQQRQQMLAELLPPEQQVLLPAPERELELERGRRTSPEQQLLLPAPRRESGQRVSPVRRPRPRFQRSPQVEELSSGAVPKLSDFMHLSRLACNDGEDVEAVARFAFGLYQSSQSIS